MEEILAYIAGKMQLAGIPYEFGEWSSTLTYPYCVGDFTADNYRQEDGCISGTMTVDVWSRGSKLQAIRMADRISGVFQDLHEISGDHLIYVHCAGADMIPSGDGELFRVSVRLTVSRWKGE